jgi:hypothetical protein
MYLKTYSTFLFAFPMFVSGASLLEALNAAGASRFAEDIQRDPSLLEIFTSPDVGTVFAIPDSFYGNATIHKRQNSVTQYQAFHNRTILEEMATLLNSKTGDVAVPEVDSVRKRKLRLEFGNGTIPSAPLRISTGLGKKSKVIGGDIFYDAGVIHLVEK